MTRPALVPAALVLAALLVGGSGPAPAPAADRAGDVPGNRTPGEAVVPAADHHVHVRSPAATEVFRRAQRAADQEAVPEERLRPTGAAEAIAALDSAGIRQGVLLSVAYMFGMPDLEVEHERRKVREENDYVARQAAKHPDRLVGFFSVNPLADYALEEIERCADDPRLTGLKLHLANSDVDLRNPEHVDRLAEVFAKAEELDLPVVVHLWTRTEGYGAEDVNAFVDEVLPSAPSVPVQVAHLGGGGGFSDATRRAVDAFLQAFRDHPDRTENVFFDLAAVPVPLALAEGDSALAERVRKINRAVAGAVRKLGLDRVVWGTDWDAVSLPGYVEGVRSDLPLERETFRDLVDDRAPYLR